MHKGKKYTIKVEINRHVKGIERDIQTGAEREIKNRGTI